MHVFSNFSICAAEASTMHVFSIPCPRLGPSTQGPGKVRGSFRNYLANLKTISHPMGDIREATQDINYSAWLSALISLTG